MEKELKRYYLTSYCGTRETIVQTNQEYDELVAKARKYSNRKKSKFLFGNITRETQSDGIHVTAHYYRKLTDASTISDLLNFTSNFSKEELADYFRDKVNFIEGYIPDINIAYKEDKNKGSKEEVHYDRRIKYLPVLYKEDRKFLSIEYIKKCLRYHVDSRHFGILKDLGNELCFNKDSAAELENLYITIDRCEHQNYSLELLYNAAVALIEKYTYEINRKDKTVNREDEGDFSISMRRRFDVGMFFKYCGDLSQKHSPVRYNEGPTKEMKEKLKKEEEEKRVRELIKAGKIVYEQMSLF